MTPSSLYHILIFYLLSCSQIDTSLEPESHSSDIEHGKSKYFREENELVSPSNREKYQKLIEKAEENHKKQLDDNNQFIFHHQIELDFSYWKNQSIDFNDIELYAKKHDLTLYQIIDHQLYRQDRLIFPPRNYGIEHFLLNIVHSLPNMEFLVNTFDWPKDERNFPIFSFSKSLLSHHTDILYPAWAFWEGGPVLSHVYPTGIGRWDIMREVLDKAREEIPWSKKDSRGFFRGSKTSSERDPLVLLSRQRSDLVDAQYTKNQAWKSDRDTLGYPPANELKHEDFCQYKYLFNFRGVAASFRLKHLFLCDSLVLHVGSDWIEFFYDQLEPWYHYIPLTTDLADVENILLFIQTNDELVEKIARQGKDFIWEFLTMENVERYWKEVLLEYYKLTGNKREIIAKSNFIQVQRQA